MSKQQLVIIGAGEFQLPLVLKAKELGYETHAFAWEQGAVARDAADHFYPISICDMGLILEKCKKIKPCGIVSIGSDLASPTVCYLSEKLGLHSNKFEVAKRCTDKVEMRKIFNENDIAPVFYKCVDKDTDLSNEELVFPLVVKPTDRSGSRSVYKVMNVSELKTAVDDACNSSFSGKAIVEQFIDGEEYSCESISYNGKHHFLALTKKFTTGAPNYIETGHIEPSGVDDATIEKIKALLNRAFDALGVTDGATHAEIKIDGDKINIIEIGARMGGDCIGSDLVYLSTGYDFVKMVIDVACSVEPKIEKTYKPHNFARIDFIFNQDGLNRLEEIKRNNPDSIVRVSDIITENFDSVTDSTNRAGYYITVG